VKKVFRIIAFGAALLACACVKAESDPVTPEETPTKPVIVAPENVYVAYTGTTAGEIPVIIKNSDGWTPAVEKSGCVTHVDFDASRSVINYTVGANTSTEEIRGAVTLSLNKTYQESVISVISVLQSGAPTAKCYKKVTSTPNDWSGTYLIVACDSKNYYYAANGKVSSSWLGTIDVSVESNEISITEETEAVEAVISKLGDKYAIKFSGGYLGSSNSNSGIMIDDTANGDEFFWNFTFNGGLVQIYLPEIKNRFLCYNGSGIRAYTTTTGVQCTLYKKQGDPEPENPTVTTGSVSDITKNSAVVHGSYANLTPAVSRFRYGTSKTSLDKSVEAVAAAGYLSAQLNNLSPATKYYFLAEVQTGTNTYTGAIGEFQTGEDGGGGGGGGTGKADYGWYELPGQVDKDRDGIDDNNSDYYYSHTFRADASSIRNFSCCYSKSKIHPVWVAAPFHKCYTGSSGRNDSYQSDPNIKCTQAGRWSGYTRGHMVGSSDRTVSVATNRQAFYYSNIGAQLSSGFNTGGGRWNNLESYIDDKWCPDTLYMVNGCIFETWTDRSGNTVSPKTADGSAIPTAYYKAVLRTKKGNTGKALKNCTADEIMCAAFIIAHKSYDNGIKPSSKDMYSITELEALTGLTYFVNVPQAPKSTYSASDWGL